MTLDHPPVELQHPERGRRLYTLTFFRYSKYIEVRCEMSPFTYSSENSSKFEWSVFEYPCNRSSGWFGVGYSNGMVAETLGKSLKKSRPQIKTEWDHSSLFLIHIITVSQFRLHNIYRMYHVVRGIGRVIVSKGWIHDDMRHSKISHV